MAASECASLKKPHDVPLSNRKYVAGVNLQCDECSELFYFHDDFINHMAIAHGIDHPYRCSDCVAEFKHKTSLMVHVRIKHSKTEKGGVAEQGHQIQPDWRHRCDQCPRSYVYKKDLMRHVRKKHYRFPCNQCSKSFKQKSSLHRHQDLQHSDKQQSVACNRCGATFTRTDSLS